MSRRSLIFAVLAAAVLILTGAALRAKGPLRVCADPNNLPYTNDRLEGFENRLAEMVAHDLGFSGVRYTWWAQRRGFLRSTLNAGTCDVVMGVPRNIERVLTSRPYYRSTYVFVSRADRQLRLSSLDDPQLRRERVGVQLIGDEGANSPPAHALSRRGIVNNVVGYSIYGDYTSESPPARIIEAVAAGEIDVAIAWGPLAGFFAARQPVALEIKLLERAADSPSLPFAFDISMAVRRGDSALRDRLDRVITTRRREIDALLAKFHVPRVN